MSRSRIVKLSLGCLLLLAAAWQSYRYFWLTLSAEAVITAETIMVRVPIAGYVIHSLKAGDLVQPEQQFGEVNNPLVDQSRRAELQAKVERLGADGVTSGWIRGEFSRLGNDLRSRDSLFERFRSKQQQAEVAQATASLAADRARLDEASARLERVAELRAQNLASQETADTALRDKQVAEQSVAAAEKQLERATLAVESIRRGVMTGDLSANDASYSRQRIDEVNLRMLGVAGADRQREAELRAAQTELEAESARVRREEHAVLSVPRRARVLEVLAAAGEYVEAGGEVARLSDCDRFYVMTYVNERRFSRLRVGSRAHIRLTGRPGEHDGKVRVPLGPAELLLPNHGAAHLDARLRDRYAVVVTSDTLAKELGNDCSVGLSATVEFD